MIYESYSASDTMRVARDIAKSSVAGEVYALTGELGAGKTVFTKGFAEGLGITRLITSPTFTIINEYRDGRAWLYHFDVYRIRNIAEMEDTGYEEYFYGTGVCLVEWAELVEPIIPKSAIWIKMEYDYTMPENYRRITVCSRSGASGSIIN